MLLFLAESAGLIPQELKDLSGPAACAVIVYFFLKHLRFERSISNQERSEFLDTIQKITKTCQEARKP